ncbi:anti-repressor SinI family protein [Ammoniphilus oxalaticus]|nr:anti-repressor SinI family protein [Ammoniphilus oxalaticus]
MNNVKQMDQHDIPLDLEWEELILQAKEIGLTVDEIRAFLNQKK